MVIGLIWINYFAGMEEIYLQVAGPSKIGVLINCNPQIPSFFFFKEHISNIFRAWDVRQNVQAASHFVQEISLLLTVSILLWTHPPGRGGGREWGSPGNSPPTKKIIWIPMHVREKCPWGERQREKCISSLWGDRRTYAYTVCVVSETEMCYY